MSADVYTEAYYERGEESGLSLYSDYRWMPELTIPLAHELVTQLNIQRTDDILDFGCAKGYLVHALRLLKYQAYGYDVSEYAVSKAHDDVRTLVTTRPSMQPLGRLVHRPYDWIIAKDVLEHVSYTGLKATLTSLWINGHDVFVVVPLGDGKKYNYEEYEKDKTHVIRESLEWWAKEFTQAEFRVLEATTDMLRIKDRCPHPQGNGFFVLRSIK